MKSSYNINSHSENHWRKYIQIELLKIFVFNYSQDVIYKIHKSLGFLKEGQYLNSSIKINRKNERIFRKVVRRFVRAKSEGNHPSKSLLRIIYA